MGQLQRLGNLIQTNYIYILFIGIHSESFTQGTTLDMISDIGDCH